MSERGRRRVRMLAILVGGLLLAGGLWLGVQGLARGLAPGPALRLLGLRLGLPPALPERVLIEPAGVAPAPGEPLPPFEIGRYEVTFAEYELFALDEGRPLPEDQGWGRGRRPVLNVSWLDAAAYGRWLSRRTGLRCGLPTGEQWALAAGAGQAGAWFWGDTSRRAPDFAWYLGNSGGRTAPVGTRAANPLGLYDTAGNVWEWAADCADDPGGPSCDRRTLRGGSWFDRPRQLRTATTASLRAHNRSHRVGFRVVCEPAQSG